MGVKTLGRGIKTDEELNELLEQAKKRPPMTPAERREQAISFVYGNLMKYPNITREMVERVYDELHPNEKAQ